MYLVLGNYWLVAIVLIKPRLQINDQSPCRIKCHIVLSPVKKGVFHPHVGSWISPMTCVCCVWVGGWWWCVCVCECVCVWDVCGVLGLCVCGVCDVWWMCLCGWCWVWCEGVYVVWDVCVWGMCVICVHVGMRCVCVCGAWGCVMVWLMCVRGVYVSDVCEGFVCEMWGVHACVCVCVWERERGMCMVCELRVCVRVCVWYVCIVWVLCVYGVSCVYVWCELCVCIHVHMHLHFTQPFPDFELEVSLCSHYNPTSISTWCYVLDTSDITLVHRIPTSDVQTDFVQGLLATGWTAMWQFLSWSEWLQEPCCLTDRVHFI
jgi:hypothetical protein